LTLAERALRSGRIHTERKITKSILGHLYKRHGIKRKKVHVLVDPPTTEITDYVSKLNNCRAEVKDALAKGLEIVYVDETYFTRNTYLRQDYAAKYSRVVATKEDLYTPYSGAVAAVSNDMGLVYFKSFNGSMNGNCFAEFVDAVSLRRKRKPFAILMDNASYHKTNDLKEICKQLEVT